MKMAFLYLMYYMYVEFITLYLNLLCQEAKVKKKKKNIRSVCVVLLLLPWENIVVALVPDSCESLPFFIPAHYIAFGLDNSVSGFNLSQMNLNLSQIKICIAHLVTHRNRAVPQDFHVP